MSTLLEEALRVRANAVCLVDETQIDQAFDRLAREITEVYRDQNPMVLCVMNGGLFPTAELTRRLTFAFEQDYLHASRYRSGINGGALVWKRQPDPSHISGRHVLVIDDILDEGHTLIAIRKALSEFSPVSLRVAVLAEKKHERRAEGAFAEFIGVRVNDHYVFGCGMDYKEYWRQLPAIYAAIDK